MDNDITIFRRILDSDAQEEETRLLDDADGQSQNMRSLADEESKVNDLFRAGRKILYKIKTLFPFDLFPDELTIDPIKVNHVHRMFFFTEQINTYLLENIKSITMENFLVFSKIILFDDKSINSGVVIGPFFRKDALKAYNLIHGLMASLKRKVDITRIRADKDLEKLTGIGMAITN